MARSRKLEVSCKTLWDLWKHNQFKNLDKMHLSRAQGFARRESHNECSF